MKERDVSFFRPLWRRVAVTAVCLVWAVAELIGRDGLWITITLSLTAYAVWTLFITFPKTPLPPAKENTDAPPPA